jgi:hypothetical protein
MSDREGFNVVRYEQALEVYRKATESLLTGLTALTLALVTLLGIAVSDRSWGIAMVGAFHEPFMLLIITAYHKRVERVLTVAKQIEMEEVGESRLTIAILRGAHEAVTSAGVASEQTDAKTERGFLRSWAFYFRSRRQQTFIALVGFVHVTVVCYLAIFENWPFARP